MFSGLDRSGTPNAPDENSLKENVPEIYLACAVCVPDSEAVDRYFADWRQRCGFPKTYEFHSRYGSTALILEGVQFALANAQISAVFFDKERLQSELGGSVYERPNLLTAAIGLIAIEDVLQQSQLKKIWCDEDIQGKEDQKEFDTAVKRFARSYWPKIPTMRHLPSGKSNMVQLADMVAYGLQRDIRGLPETAGMRKTVRELARKEGNRIWEIGGDDLRPYL